MIHAEPIQARTALDRVPGVLGDAGIVVPPQVGPAQRGQLREVLNADESLASFVHPMRAGVPVADKQVRLLQPGFGGL